MEIIGAEFDFLTDPPDPSYVMRVTIRVTDVQQPSAYLVAQVGELPIRDLISLFEQDGVSGFLTAEPPPGAQLQIGYAGEDLIDTGISYQPPVS